MKTAATFMSPVCVGQPVILLCMLLMCATLSARSQPGVAPNDAEGAELVPLPLKLPLPSMSKNGPSAFYQGPQVEKGPFGARRPFLAPMGVTNVALGKPVTSSRKIPILGRLAQITDGTKEDQEEQVVVLSKGPQWVQVDLQQEHEIYALLFWHDHRGSKFFRDVVVQLSNDPAFAAGVTTLFNNDWDNSVGLGLGTDKEYYESHEGRLVDAKRTKARYIRLYSNGHMDLKEDAFITLNHYQEIEVYGLPAAPGNTKTDRVPLPLKLPLPSMSVNGPGAIYEGPHIEAPPFRQRPPFYTPVGVTNLAAGKLPTTSAREVHSGRLVQLTDGLKEDADDQVVVLPIGLQWVQIDLGREHEVYAIVFWHDITGLKYFRDVVVQVSNDPAFAANVHTLFNNDHDNSSGLGLGRDKEYYDGYEGKLVDAKGLKARYIRLYSNGYMDGKAGDYGSFSPLNHYQELEVYGLRVK